MENSGSYGQNTLHTAMTLLIPAGHKICKEMWPLRRKAEKVVISCVMSCELTGSGCLAHYRAPLPWALYSTLGYRGEAHACACNGTPMASVAFTPTLCSPEREGGERLTSFLTRVSQVQDTELGNGVPAEMRQVCVLSHGDEQETSAQ